tara:strand:+ start:11953 stop:14058 length:2106 start_codon:yes stop_codon:yes gene_type:complete
MSDTKQDKKDIIAQIQALTRLLELDGQKKERKNLEEWKKTFKALQGIVENPLPFLLTLIKETQAYENSSSKVREKKENFRANIKKAKKQGQEELQAQADDARDKGQAWRERANKQMLRASQVNYSALLSKVIKQAIFTVIPKIKHIVIEEILAAFNCDLSMNVPVVGDGISCPIEIKISHIDLFKNLKLSPDEGVGKFAYEAEPYVAGSTPFSMNRFLHFLLQNPNTPYQVQGKSGLNLFTIEYDGGDYLKISPHYKASNGGAADNNSVFDGCPGPGGQASPGDGTKFTVIEFVVDYFENIRLFQLHNILGAILELLSGLITFGNGGVNLADLLGINELIKVLNNIIGACDGGDLGEVGTDTKQFIQELDDDDSWFRFNVEEQQNLVDETNRKRKGVIALQSCAEIEIPLDLQTFIDAADDIIQAELVQAGSGFKTFELIIQNGLAESADKEPDPYFNPLDWSIDFKEELIVKFPDILMIALLSPKLCLPVVLVYKFLNENALLASNPKEWMKIFKRVVVRIAREVLAEVVRILFNIVIGYLTKMLMDKLKRIIGEKGKKYIKVVTALINALMPWIDELRNAKDCKSILDTLLRLLEAVAPDVPFGVPPWLLFATKKRAGTSSLRTFEKLITKLEEFGYPTGDMPSGEPNLDLLGQFALIESMDDEKSTNGRVQSISDPATASGPPGLTIIPPIVSNGLYL